MYNCLLMQYAKVYSIRINLHVLEGLVRFLINYANRITFEKEREKKVSRMVVWLLVVLLRFVLHLCI